MKFASIYYQGSPQLAIVLPDHRLVSLQALGFRVRDMQQLIETSSDRMLERVGEALEAAAGQPELYLDPSQVRLRSPLRNPKSDLICMGVNYRAHAVESQTYLHPDETDIVDRGYPVYFGKRAARTVGHGERVNGHFDIVEDLDYEVELAVVIGERASRVAPEDVYKHIFGYTIANDFSARTLQNRYKQWYFGKSLDDFSAIGPWIVTRDEVAYPPALGIRSYVNDELRQEAVTDQLIFSIDYAISELSMGITLEPGTLLLTGTPAGVGFAGPQKRFLRPGDWVRCEIDGIGVLENEII